MAAFVRFGIPHRYIGASTDTKPATAEVGSLCYEYDTGKTYVTYNGAAWTEYAPTTYLNDISAETLTLSGGAGALTFSAAATIVAAAGLTLPAVTLGGAVTGNAQTISNANVTVGASRTLDVSAGTLTLAADQISGDKVEGGTINAVTINTLTLGTTLTGADKPFTGLGDFTFTDGSIIATATSDSATLIFKSTDDDGAALAQLEVMRLVGANDPYVAFGGSQQSIFYNSGAITIGGNVTFGAGLAIASGAVNGNTLLLKANDTTLMTFTTGATDTLDIGAHSISGNVTVGSGLSLSFDTYGIKITDTYIQFGDDATALGPKLMYGNATRVAVFAADGTSYADIMLKTVFIASDLSATGGIYWNNHGYLGTATADGKYVKFLATDDDGAAGAQLEIARMVSANDPYFSMGGSQQWKFLNSGPVNAGTSGSPLALTVGAPYFALYSTCADLGTGNAEPFYVKNTLTGAGAYGGRSRFDLVVNAAAGDYVNALKAYTSFGASGRVTGLASGFCAELALSAGTTSGSYAALEAELVAGAGASAGTATSFLYCNATGDGATVINGANGFLFELGAGVTDTEGGIFEAEVNNDSMSMTHVFKCRVAGVTYYIPLNTSKGF